MHMRYRELVGKQVIAADGRGVGHIAELVAQQRGAALCVTALRVGPRAIARRIAFKRVPPPAIEVPWGLVARIDAHVHLRVGSDDLARKGPRPPDDDTVMGRGA